MRKKPAPRAKAKAIADAELIEQHLDLFDGYYAVIKRRYPAPDDDARAAAIQLAAAHMVTCAITSAKGQKLAR